MHAHAGGDGGGEADLIKAASRHRRVNLSYFLVAMWLDDLVARLEFVHYVVEQLWRLRGQNSLYEK